MRIAVPALLAVAALPALLAFFVHGGLTTASAESWTSLDGTRTVSGTMVGLWDDHVILLLNDGRRVTVPMSGLIATSRIQAEQLHTKRLKQQATLKAELRARAEIEAAPAPDPLPVPPTPPDLVKIEGSDDAATMLNTIAEQLRSGHFSILWDALPARYQNDLQTLVRSSIDKLDPLKVEAPIASLHRLSELIVTRQNWIASHPRMLDPATRAATPTTAVFREVVLPVASAIRVGLPPEQTRFEKWKTIDLGEWLREADAEMAPHLATWMQSVTASGETWALVDSTDESQTINRSADSGNIAGPYGTSGATSGLTIQMTRVDERWVPAAMAAQWNQWIADQTERIKAAPPQSMSLSSVLGIDPKSANRNNPYADPSFGGAGSLGASKFLSFFEKLPMLDPIIEMLKTPTEAAAFHQTIDQSISSLTFLRDLVAF